MEYILQNGVKLIYRKRPSRLTSISIGLDAGAAVETDILGLAHATEHMVFKGTKTKNEQEINKELTQIFGFHNAMTNYPYVIYYGTLLQEDLAKGLDIFSDILINPTFNSEGFNDEMDVIRQELKEWDEDLEQYLEDRLYFNSFNNRLKYPIIGRMKDLDRILLKDVKKFYKTFYSPQNTTIAIVSDFDFEQIKKIVEKYFSKWTGSKVDISKENIDIFSNETYSETKEGINTSKVEMIFSIRELNSKQLMAFRLFNEFFAAGVNSVLFDILRTKSGLVYDVTSTVSIEKHIKLYKIIFSTSKEKLEEAINSVKQAIDQIESYQNILNDEKIKELSKSIKLKQLFKEEQSITVAKELSTHNVMFGNTNIYEDMLDSNYNISGKEIIDCAKKVLKLSKIEKIGPVGSVCYEK